MARASRAGGDAATAASAGRQSARPLRADARRNRDAVLVAATAAFAAEGVGASLEDIARRAGVGVGTLYRHFPTREALVLGVYEREVESLAASADDLAATLEPAAALREWMRRFVRYAATKRGLVGMLRTMVQDDSELFDRAKSQIAAAARKLLGAAVDAGQIRADVTAEDLTRSMSGICMVSGRADEPDCAGRLIDIVYDGLRYGASAEPAAAR
jgi:AcrR family transcriptional regulator